MSESKRTEVPPGIEALLRESLATAPPPELPASFTGTVTDRLRRRRLPPRARRTLWLYCAAAAIVSAGVMAWLGVEVVVIAAALAGPAAIALLLRKRLF